MRILGHPFIMISMLTFAGCLTEKQEGSSGTKSGARDGVSSLSSGEGLVLRKGPAELTKNQNLDLDSVTQFSKFVQRTYLTSKNDFSADCTTTDSLTTQTFANCFQVKNSRHVSSSSMKNQRFPYAFGQSGFVDGQAFYHVQLSTENILKIIGEAQYSSYSYPHSSLPSSLLSQKLFWSLTTLSVFSDCPDTMSNAYFSPAQYEVCFGHDEHKKEVKLVYEPNIIYHEMGHVFLHHFFNIRNRLAPQATLQTRLGDYFMDEALAINEGLADFFSYSLSSANSLSPWYLQNYQANRPLHEDSPLHAPFIDSSDQGRLLYPDFLHYNPNKKDSHYRHCLQSSDEQSLECLESPHQAGMIVSHSMAALGRDLIDYCSYSQTYSIQVIWNSIIETMAENGDIKNRGKNLSGLFGSFSNLASGSSLTDELRSKVWSEVVHPLNFRKFYQSFARNLLNLLPIQKIPCHNYSSTLLEKKLDQYGLLLFKSYNNNGGDKVLGQASSVPVIQVNEANRHHSQLIAKDFLSFPTEEAQPKAYVFDDGSSMRALLESMAFAGTPLTLSPLTPSDLRYNNGNGKVSPGELVGLAFNLKNNSNQLMGGVQVLGSDWDHEENLSSRPCQLSDKFPKTSEGGSTSAECALTDENNLRPICYVEVKTQQQTQWVSQKTFKNLNSSTPCLDSNAPETCLVRVVKEKSFASYLFLYPGKTWGESIVPSNADLEIPQYGPGNTILLEINKHVPPGTKFSCRFRARFTNCSDCFQDPSRVGLDNDDFRDYSYAGETPFKLLNLSFTVGP